MAEEQLVFDNTVEALFRRALGPRISPSIRERIKAEANIDLAGKLNPSYPRTAYYKALHVVAQELYRGVPTEKAMFDLGEAFINGFSETLLGRTVLSVVKMLGPRRSLGRMSQNFRSSNNYLITKLTEHSPTEFDLWLSETSGVPTYFQGVLNKALTHSGAKNLSITVSRFDGREAVLHLKWEDK